jgi:hypothetical protein
LPIHGTPWQTRLVNQWNTNVLEYIQNSCEQLEAAMEKWQCHILFKSSSISLQSRFKPLLNSLEYSLNTI